MEKIDIEKFVLDMIRLTWENKFLATCSMKALGHQALKFVDTPDGGKIVGIERLKCPCDDCPAMVPGGCALTCSKFKAYKEKLESSPVLSNSSGTGKDELTEFEKAVEHLMGQVQCGKLVNFTVTTKEQAKELLSIARKQIADDIDLGALVDSYKKIISDFPNGAMASLDKEGLYRVALIDIIRWIKG